MPDDLRARIAAALQNHRQGRVGVGWLTCSCDGHWSRFASAVYDGHVADAVIRELNISIIEGPYTVSFAGSYFKESK